MKRSREPEDELAAASPAAHGSAEMARTVTVTVSVPTARQQEQEPPAAKIAGLDESAVDETSASSAMRCALPGHREPMAFRTYAEYEAHYHKTHTNRCGECRKNFPSEHLLNLHIEEAHDAFAAVLREKGERTYSCFVEGCDRKCRTPYKRRMHLIDKHMYPKNYFFAVTKEGIDGRSSLLLERGHHQHRDQKSSASQAGRGFEVAGSGEPDGDRMSVEHPKEHPKEGTSPQENPGIEEVSSERGSSDKPATEEKADTDMTDLTSAMSALQFIPTSVRFGRGKGRAGFSRK